MNNERLYDRIQDLCRKHNTNINQLEKALGTASGTILKWQNHLPSITKLKEVADYFNVSTDYILGRTQIRVTADNAVSDPDIVTIQRLRSRLSTKDNERMMKLLQLQFEDDFPTEGENNELQDDKD